MEYLNLGKSGLKISQLSFGSWITFDKQLDFKKVMECMRVAFESGVNFFDNAEVYANGKSEELMGQALRELAWPRVKYIVSTKFFWGLDDGPNERNTLNRKYLLHAIEGSLKRLQLEYVDLVYCHRPDQYTPIEETVWAMHDMIQRGYALYWGTSEWSSAEIMEAWQIADKHHLHKPIVEQPQYNLFFRSRVEVEYQRLYKDIGLGLTTWSPLASGLLTGKYLDGIAQGTRASSTNLAFVSEAAADEMRKPAIRKFVKLAKELNCTPSQLAIAWCASNPHVSSVITGASRVEQLKENLESLRVIEMWSEEIQKQVESCFD